MTRQHFHDTLDQMERQLLTMGDLVGTAVSRSVEAVVRHNDDIAQSVIQSDDRIDELYLEIDSGILQLLALQQPVAADLRLVSAILHSCLHLDRIGALNEEIKNHRAAEAALNSEAQMAETAPRGYN